MSFAWTALDGVTQYFFEFTGPNLQFTNPDGESDEAEAREGSALVSPRAGVC